MSHPVIEDPDPATVEHLKAEGASEASAGKVSIVATGVEIRGK